MAVFSFVFVPGEDPDISASLATVTSTAEIVLGNYKIFAVNATKDITIAFGRAGMAAAGATNFRIPANTTQTFDLGGHFDRIRIFNLDAASTNYYVKGFSKI